MSLLQSRRWLRAELTALATFHLALGLVVAFAPAKVVITSGSINAFQIMPHVLTVEGARLLWGLSFSLCALVISWMAWRLGHLKVHHQQIGWYPVFLVDLIWLLAYLLPLTIGRGSAIGATVFPALLVWSFFAMIRVAHTTGG